MNTPFPLTRRRHAFPRLAVAAILALLLVPAGLFAQSTEYWPQVLAAPDEAPGDETRALALNNLGEVFGVAGVLVASYVPVVWSGGGSSVLPVPSGHVVVTGFGSGFGWDFVNDSGTVVSMAKSNAITHVNRGYRAIVWQNGVPEILTLPPQANAQAYADGQGVTVDELNIFSAGLNAANHILVYTCGAYWIWNAGTYNLVVQQGPFTNPRASQEGNHLNDSGHVLLDGLAACNTPSIYQCLESRIYSPTGAFDVLPPSGPNLGSTYINNSDQVLAHFTGADNQDQLVLWDGTNAVQLGAGGYAALNDLGDVVFASGFPRTSFIYSKGVISPLSVPAPMSGPFFLNNTGQIVANTTLTVSQPYAVLFTPRHPLTTGVSPLEAGTITVNPLSPDGLYDSGTSVQLTATPAPGYVFSNWSGDLTGNTSPDSIVMLAPRSVTANFVPVATVTIDTQPAGREFSVDGASYTSPQSFEWVVGSSHTIATTTPQLGSTGTRFVFTGWSDAGALSHEITVPESGASYTASFVTQYSLSTATAPAGAGVVATTPTAVDGFYDAGTVVQLSAIPNTGFVFSEWVGDLTGTTNPQSLEMSAPRSVAANFSPVSVQLQSLTIAPLSPTIFVGSSIQFVVIGHYSDGSTQDLTSTATWSSSKSSIATVTSPGGLATGVAKGNTTIRAFAGAFSASTVLAVKAVALQSITVTPATAAISVGGMQQFRAIGNYSDGSTRDITDTVGWSSAPKSVASVSSTGLATGLKPGTGTVTAKSGGTGGTAVLTVN